MPHDPQRVQTIRADIEDRMARIDRLLPGIDNPQTARQLLFVRVDLNKALKHRLGTMLEGRSAQNESLLLSGIEHLVEIQTSIVEAAERTFRQHSDQKVP